MTTDNWVKVMWDTYEAAGPFSLLLFPVVIIMGNFITLNIFLAILLSTFAAASKAEAEAADAAVERESVEIAEAANRSVGGWKAAGASAVGLGLAGRDLEVFEASGAGVG